MTIADLNENFIWTKDRPFAGWKLLDGEGELHGDCEDYALTVAWIEAGYSRLRLVWWIITFRAVFWFCLSAGNRRTHWVLWLRGRGWIDNITGEWRAKTPHKKLVPVPLIPAVLTVFA